MCQWTTGIGSDNGLLPIQFQAIINTNVGLLSIGPLGTNFSEFLIKIQNFDENPSKNITSVKSWTFCPGGDELMSQWFQQQKFGADIGSMASAH